MSSSAEKTRKIAVAIAVAAYLAVSFFTLSGLFVALPNGGEMVSGCFLEGHDAVCPMTFAEHVRSWRTMFAAWLGQADFLTLAAALIVLAGFILFFKLIQHWRSLSLSCFRKSQFYQRASFILMVFAPLRMAFSQGVINPKIY